MLKIAIKLKYDYLFGSMLLPPATLCFITIPSKMKRLKFVHFPHD